MSSNDKNFTPVPKIRGGISKVRSRWKLIMLIFVYIAVLLLNGLDEFIQTGFDFEYLGTPEWWYRVFRTLFSNLLVFLGTFTYFLDYFLRNNEKYLSLSAEVEKLVSLHMDPNTFDPFFIDFERDRKIEYYKKAIDRKQEALDHKASFQDRELWFREKENVDDEGNVKDEGLHKKFLKNKYCQKKLTLQRQSTDEFINKHINYIDIDYGALSPNFVKSGYHINTDKDGYAVESGTSKFFRDLRAKIGITFIILGLLESIGIGIKESADSVEIFYNLAKKIIPLFIQVIMAVDYAETFVKEKHVDDLQKRKDILIRYLSETKEKGAES